LPAVTVRSSAIIAPKLGVPKGSPHDFVQIV
jgi:hypothetical protein